MKTNLLQRLGMGIALVGVLGLFPMANITGQPTQSRKEIYSSPVIKPEHGFRVISRTGNVDENKHIYIEGGYLYVVGFSSVHKKATDSMADASTNALNKIISLNKNKSPMVDGTPTLKEFSCPDYENIKLTDGNGGEEYATEMLCRIALKDTKNLRIL